MKSVLQITFTESWQSFQWVLHKKVYWCKIWVNTGALALHNFVILCLMTIKILIPIYWCWEKLVKQNTWMNERQTDDLWHRFNDMFSLAGGNPHTKMLTSITCCRNTINDPSQRIHGTYCWTLVTWLQMICQTMMRKVSLGWKNAYKCFQISDESLWH